MMRSVLFSVHWLTDFGGLHENVLDTVSAFVRDQWRCVVIAPKAKFNVHFRLRGAKVIEHDFNDIDETARLAAQSGPFDLVHAHPFQALIVGAAVAKKFGSKLLLTIHGQYLDKIEASFDGVICVADRIAEYIRSQALIDPARIHVIPNAVDAETFRISRMSAIRRALRKVPVITVCSRIDPDKDVLLRCIKDTISYLAECGEPVELHIQGENLWGDVREFMEAIETLAKNSCVSLRMKPWCDDRSRLGRILNGSDIVIASGRAATESLACLRPTIAVASRGYVGLLDRQSIELGIKTNFGGCYGEDTAYSKERLILDLEKAKLITRRALESTRNILLAHNSLQIVSENHCALARNLFRECGLAGYDCPRDYGREGRSRGIMVSWGMAAVAVKAAKPTVPAAPYPDASA